MFHNDNRPPLFVKRNGHALTLELADHIVMRNGATPRLQAQEQAARKGPQHFTDPAAEAAVAGSIAHGGFDRLSASDLIPPEAFTEPHWRTLYTSAARLLRQGEPVCAASVNDHIAFVGCEREIAAFVGNKVTAWQQWPMLADVTLGTGLAILRTSLATIARLYRKRKAREIAGELESSDISLEDAHKALGELLHQANGTSFSFEALDARRFDMARLHEKPVAVFKLAGQAISTPGNLTSIFAQAKAGKSAVVGAIIGATMAAGPDGDFLNWSSSLNPDGFALIHFDSEQSPYDHQQVVFQAMTRAGLKEPPPWLYSYCLTDLGVADKWAAIPYELERAQQRHGAIYAVIIDGLGDFVLDTNNAEEANTVVATLHALAIKYNTVVVQVLHENPDSTGKGNVKMRGHLGSQMERKSESNIRLAKDKNEVTTQFTVRSRHAAISEAKGPRFSFDLAKGMHASIGTAEATASEADRRVVAEMFKGPDALGGLTWTQCHERIEKIEGLKRAGARGRFDKYIRLKLIVENPNAKDFYIEKHG